MAKEKTKKPRRPRAETPRGFRDAFGAEVRARDAMLRRITEVYHSYGFDPLETGAVETVEALGKFLPDVDRPNEGVFAWRDEDEDWLALRYDLTAPLARVYAQHRQSLPTPYRRYAAGPVWRNEKPGPGRFRQFYQCDADTVGSASVAADAEICVMLGEALEAAGIAAEDYVIRVNNRKVLNGVMERAGRARPRRSGGGCRAARRGSAGDRQARPSRDRRRSRSSRRRPPRRERGFHARRGAQSGSGRDHSRLHVRAPGRWRRDLRPPARDCRRLGHRRRGRERA